MSTHLSTQKSIAPSFNFFDAQQFEVMQKISTMFSNSELVPDMYRSSEKVSEAKASANCMIALSLAQRMGADALMVMQNLVIIYGRPSWSSKFLIATVNTCGRFDAIKYRSVNKGKLGTIQMKSYIDKLAPGTAIKVKTELLTPFDASNIDNIEMVAYSVERSTGEELIGSTVSILMAIQEGWYTKNGSKWVTMPEKMLKYRAASFWVNEYAPEISMGMKTEEEAYDIEDIEHTEIFEKSVKEDIAANANKTPIDFPDPQPPVDNTKSAIQPNQSFDGPVVPEQKSEPVEGQPAKAPF